jgi:hypothetical protein
MGCKLQNSCKQVVLCMVHALVTCEVCLSAGHALIKNWHRKTVRQLNSLN